MENTRKSDVVAFCMASKVDLYNYLDRLQRGQFLTINEQKNIILNQFQCLDMMEHITNQNEQNIGRINEAQRIIETVQSVENIIQSTIYKFYESWK